MAVFRVIKDKENPYIMINKYYIYDNRLSLKAKGLMSYFLSRPDDWEFYQVEILKHCTDKKDSLSSAINELVKTGYVERTFKRGEKGKLKGGYDYTVHEIPNIITNEEDTCTEESTECGFPETGKNRNRENPVSENPPLLNNDLILNNDNNTTTTENKPVDNVDNFVEFFNNNFSHLMTPFELQTLQSYVKDGIAPQVITLALQEAVEADIRDMRYVKKILNRWLENKILTVEAVLADKRKFGSKGKKKKTNIQQPASKKESTFNNFKQRNYDFKDLEKKLLGWE